MNCPNLYAEDLILAVFCGQRENGFIPCCTSAGLNHPRTSTVTQSPIIAWGAWLVYEKTGVVFEFYDSANKVAPYRLKRKGEPYNIDVRVQTIRDYG